MKPAPEGDLKAWLDKLLPHNPTMVSTLAGLSGVGVLPVRFIPWHTSVPPRQQTDTGTPNLLAVTQHGNEDQVVRGTLHIWRLLQVQYSLASCRALSLTIARAHV